MRFTPCIPADWKSFSLHYHYRKTFYHITFTRTGAARSVTVDGQVCSDGSVHLVDDQREHFVRDKDSLRGRGGLDFQRSISAVDHLALSPQCSFLRRHP